MNKKAFTLAELLVVVVIIGILASVVQPKFHKLVETYKAFEAERVMRAVRNEQTARCALDKDYTLNRKKLISLPSHPSNNFGYSLTATGMQAQSLSKDYMLVMKSYQSGGLCCKSLTSEEAGYCPNLVRTYPLCSEYTAVDQTGCDAE